MAKTPLHKNLFNLFIDDISVCMENSKFLLYADDLKIYRVIKSESDCILLQQDLNRLSEWCALNDMNLNIDKCKVMKFYKKKNITLYEYKIGDSILESVDVIKDLGVIFDKDLNFNDHVNYITNKALKILGYIKRSLCDFNDIHCFKILYCSYVRSIVEYACTVWSPFYGTYINQIERVQRKYLRFVGYKMGIPIENIVYDDIMKVLNIPTLENRRILMDICTLYRILNCHINCDDLLREIHLNVPQRTLREFNLFHVPFHRTNYGLSSALTRICANANTVCNRDPSIDFFL